MNRLAGKVTMVTGAGRGIGAAIALAFAREGASVALAELNIDTARATAERIASEVSGARVLAVQTDVTQSAQVKEAVAHIEAAFARKDRLKALADDEIPSYPAYGLTVAEPDPATLPEANRRRRDVMKRMQKIMEETR